jgi:hypothetical protein
MSGRVLPCVECAAPVDADIHAEELGLCLQCSGDYWGHTGQWSDDPDTDTPTVEIARHSGALLIYCDQSCDDPRLTHAFIGYDKREALTLWQQTHNRHGVSA